MVEAEMRWGGGGTRAATRAPHHDNLDGDGNGQLGFESVIELLDDKHHRHDHQGDDHVANVGGLDLVEDDLQSLRRTKTREGSHCAKSQSCCSRLT